MNDISSQNQNQANFQVPKDTVRNFASNKNLKPQNGSLKSLNQISGISSQNPRVDIIKSQELSQKPGVPLKEPGLDAIRNQIKSVPTEPGHNINPQQKTPKVINNAPPPNIPPAKAQVDTKSLISTMVRYLLIIMAAIVLGYIIVNWPALALKFNYWQNSATWQEDHPIELKGAKTTAQNFDEDYLYIESLGIQAPVSWGVENQDVKSMLSQGLVNYSAGALPDDAVGEIYVTGQTSGPIWSGSLYKTVFTLLNHLKVGDKIMLVYKNKIYTYEVESSFSKFGGIDTVPGNPSTSYLNLLAKYPVGIGLSTYIASAKLIAISDNVPASIDDKTKSGTSTELGPKTITPTSTSTPIPTSTTPYDDSTAPQVFLPNL